MYSTSLTEYFFMYSKLAVVLYVGALLWWLCHPWASFSTGELKARQLYVDENALVVQALVQSDIDSKMNGDTQLPPQQLLFESNICDHVQHIGATSCVQIGGGNGVSSITQVVVDSPTKPLTGEAILFALPYRKDENEHAVKNVVSAFVYSLINGAPWLSRRVMILLVEVDCSNKSHSNDICIDNELIIYSKALDEWLKKQTGRDSHHGEPTERVAASLIREAYIMEISVNRNYGQHSDALGPTCELHFYGVNGALPNLDMISSTLALFGDSMTVSPQGGRNAAFDDPLSLWYSIALKTMDVIIDSITSTVGSSQSLESYYANSLGLMKSSMSMAHGRGDGLHSQFIDKNIDSITIRTFTSSKSNKQGQGAAYDELVRRMLLLGRLSSNLYEELHHSHFYYILMGSRHFVGLSEFCGPMVCAFVSFFMVSLRAIEEGLFQREKGKVLRGFSLVFLDLALAATVMSLLLLDGNQYNKLTSMKYFSTQVACSALVWVFILFFFKPLIGARVR